jgi:gliding motility-associated-like protein
MRIRNESCYAESHSNVIEIKEYPHSAPPIVAITPKNDSGFCPGDSLIIVSKNPMRGVFQWIHFVNGLPQDITAADLPAYIIRETGDYTAVYIDSNGCRSEWGNIIPVSHYPVPDQPQILPPVPLYYYGLNYVLAVYMPKDNIEYQWYKAGASTGVTGHNFNIDRLESDDITNYVVVAINKPYGCRTHSKEYEIKEASRRWLIPNIISPNGDGLNDMFEIVGLETFSENELLILNKNGIILYSATNYNNDWNGYGLPDDIYFYALKVTDNNGRKQTYRGFFHIKR